jgi:hypothetical protein
MYSSLLIEFFHVRGTSGSSSVNNDNDALLRGGDAHNASAAKTKMLVITKTLLMPLSPVASLKFATAFMPSSIRGG